MVRNLIQYPLTDQDRLQVLQRLLQKELEQSDLACGDLTIAVLSGLIESLGG